MGKFEGFLDEFMGRAKAVADTATRKTGEVVDMGKLRYDIKQTQWDIERAYAKLGEIVYEAKKGGESHDDVIDLAVDELDELNERLAELESRRRAYKRVNKCAECGKENDQDFAFCSRCGMAIHVEAGSDTNEPEPERESEPESESGNQSWQ